MADIDGTQVERGYGWELDVVGAAESHNVAFSRVESVKEVGRGCGALLAQLFYSSRRHRLKRDVV